MLLGLQDWQWYGIINKGGFRPNKIAGLQLWLDANDASTLFQDAAKTTAAGNGDVVGAWAYKSGQVNDVTQATTAKKALYKLNQINGLPALDFDGLDDFLGSLTDINQPLTICMVARNAKINSVAVAGGLATSSGVSMGVLSKPFLSASTAFQSTELAASARVFIGVINGASSNIRINGVDTLSDAGLDNFTDLAIGSFSQGSDSWADLIAEVCIYNSALALASILQIEKYFNGKWDVP